MNTAARLHPWSQRFNLKLLLLVLAIGLGINLVGLGHLALFVRSALSPADLLLLLQLLYLQL